MRLGYNTNGLAHHRLLDAIDLVGDLGYQSVAITLDAGALDPYQDRDALDREIRLVRSALDRRGLARVVETGARYLLNPRKKHDPTLLDPDLVRRGIRQDFLRRSMAIARDLGAECVSLWSGQPPADVAGDVALERLAVALGPLLADAERYQTPLAFEPEPGMLIDTLESFRALDERIAHPLFQLTIDLGHVHCLREGLWDQVLPPWRDRVLNMHVEDMVEDVHEHLMFGEGTMDFRTLFNAIRSMGYSRGIHVELSRHSHAGVEAATTAARFLNTLAHQD